MKAGWAMMATTASAKSYKTGHFFEMDPANSRGAYLLASLPFGIEYLDQVTLREINFGPADTKSQNILINDEERPVQGFKTCRDCGLTVDVSPHEENQKPAHHTRNCAASTSAQSLDWENLYLYRSVTSEALRILLPVSTTFVEEKMATFEACLDLGLRKKFRGKPDHLHILSHTEPAEDGGRRRFLVIYDSVPGGTGFLKDLARPETFFEVLQLALDTLVSCKCRLSPEKQACYRCLYSYRVQRELKLISRRLGVEMLSEILSQRASLEAIPSLSSTHIDSLIESELEQRLVYALDKYCKGKPNRSFTPIIHNGKQAWELKLGAATGTTLWIMEPQVLLGSAQQVRISSRADFVFWPQSPANARPVVVFTDGFAYHVRPDMSQGGIADDILKRRSIIQSSKFTVWSIVWDDVKAFENDENLDFHFFSPHQVAFMDQSLNASGSKLPRNLLKKNALDLLLALLTYPESDTWIQVASLLSLAALRPPRPMLAGQVLEQKTMDLRTSADFPDLSIPAGAPSGDHYYNILTKNGSHLLVDVPAKAVQNKQIAEFTLTLRLEDQQSERSQDIFRKDWHQFWQLTNLLQFLPGFAPVSAEFIQLNAAQPVAEPPLTAAVPEAWSSAFEFSAQEVHALLAACQAAGLSVPDVGYELVDSSGKIMASAEVAWEVLQTAVFLPDVDAECQSFANAGWHTFYSDQVEEILGILADG